MSAAEGYAAASSVRVPYRIAYRCCACNTENEDRSQGFYVRRPAGAFEAARAGGRARRALEEKLRDELRQRQNAITLKDYAALHLRCRCSQCGRRQPWSDFWPAGGTFWAVRRYLRRLRSDALRTFVIVLLMIAAAALLGLSIRFPVVALVLLAVLTVPSLAAVIRNQVIRRRLKKLPEAYRPDIRIASPSP